MKIIRLFWLLTFAAIEISGQRRHPHTVVEMSDLCATASTSGIHELELRRVLDRLMLKVTSNAFWLFLDTAQMARRSLDELQFGAKLVSARRRPA